MRTGLVLGGGGVPGAAYLTGALTAIEFDLGWDPRTADVIVGTSAGALVGALLRSGVPASDLAAWTVGATISPDGHVIEALEHRSFDPLAFREFLRMPRRPRPKEIWSAMRRPWRFSAQRALLTHLADGAHMIAPHTEFLGTGWPRDKFFCCAVRRHDGRRTVFGRRNVPADGLGAAVAASCAIPGYFAPVEVDGELYVDGGVASPSNADVLRDEDLDLVIVVSPMTTAEHPAQWSFDGLVRKQAARKLARELRRVRAEAVEFGPGPAVLELVGRDWMSDERVREIVAAAFLDTGSALAAATPLHALGTRGFNRSKSA